MPVEFVVFVVEHRETPQLLAVLLLNTEIEALQFALCLCVPCVGEWGVKSNLVGS